MNGMKSHPLCLQLGRVNRCLDIQCMLCGIDSDLRMTKKSKSTITQQLINNNNNGEHRRGKTVCIVGVIDERESHAVLGILSLSTAGGHRTGTISYS